MKNFKLTEIEAIVFDLDGTLYDEMDFVKSGFKTVARHVSAKYGLSFKTVYNILTSDFENGVRNCNFNILLEKLNLEGKDLSELIEIYRKHQPAIRLYPDAEATLKSLKGRFKLALLTDGWEVTQKNKISALNINEYFDYVMITDTLGKEHRKPSEKPFKMVLDRLGTPAHRAVYIGDNPLKDFVTAKQLGFFTVRVRRGGTEYDAIETDPKREADRTIPNLFNFIGLLNA
jgi:putative hydrolase of the HAD superfamily